MQLYAGIDLHASNNYLAVIDAEREESVQDKNFPMKSRLSIETREVPGRDGRSGCGVNV